MKDAFKQNFDLIIDDNRILTPVNEFILKEKSPSDKDARSMSPDSN